MIHEWIPSKALNSTIEVWGMPNGWVDRVDFLPAEIKQWKGDYILPASREILEYLHGKRTKFSHTDQHKARIAQMGGSFHQAVLLRTMQIPYGKTMAYSEVAESLSSRAWRATGTALARNPIPILVPCHRVVAKHGIGGFGGHVWLKRKLLELEGANPP